MGIIIRYNVQEIVQQVNSAARQSNNPSIDGFVGFGIKQDLYRIKWCVEDAVRRCPNFVGEDEWLRQQEKQKVIRILKNGTS